MFLRLSSIKVSLFALYQSVINAYCLGTGNLALVSSNFYSIIYSLIGINLNTSFYCYYADNKLLNYSLIIKRMEI